MTSAPALAIRACGCCGGRTFRRWWTLDGYDIGACEACDLVQVLQDVPAETLTALYSRGYYEGATPRVYQDYLADPETKGRHFGERLDSLCQDFSLKPGNLLEVGAAFGLFLDQARRRNWSVRGTESSAHAANWGNTQLGLHIDSSPQALAHVESESQDLVVMWDVIEHLKEPLNFVREAHRVLRPGGHLALTTGDIGSSGARFYGRHWFLIAPPYHLFYFTQRSITRLLTDVGLTVQRIRNEGGHPLENAGHGPALLNWIARNDRYVGWRIGDGPVMEVVARKAGRGA
jgi:2-polyprenyl-3-methyl-5-hydroxy-6-metoxy-1,4-benzoquinol methylase